MKTNNKLKRNDVIDVKLLMRKLTAKWYYFIISLMITIGIAVIYNKITNRVYLVRGTILLKSPKSGITKPDDFLKGMEMLMPNTELEDEIGILTSRTTIEKAINQLDFGVSYYVNKKLFKTEERYGDSPFTVKLKPNVNQITEVPIYIKQLPDDRYEVVANGENVDAYSFSTHLVEDFFPYVEIAETREIFMPFESPNLAFTIKFDDRFKTSKGEKTYFVIHNLESLAESYRNSLEVNPISRESNIVELNMEGELPHKLTVFIDRLMTVYQESDVSKKNLLGLRIIDFIDSQISDVSDSLRKVESSLESFRTRNKIIDISTTAENLSKRLDDLLTEKAAVEVKLQYYEYISDYLRAGTYQDVTAPSSIDIDDPILNSTLLELSKLYREKTGLNFSARDNNPLAEVLDLKIKNAKKSLEENLNGSINATKIALNDYNKRIGQVRVNMNLLPRNERELVSIQRRFDFSDNVYNYLLEKRAETGIAIASNISDKDIVDKAKMVGAGSIAPNTKLIYFMALLAGFAGAIGLIIIKDFLNDNIVTKEDLENNTNIPLIGAISHGSKKDKLNFIKDARSLLAESFRSLRVNYQYLTLGKDHNVIGLTSSVSGEGKTFCSVNLAIVMAQAGKKTLIIDTDMRRPQVANYLNFDNKRGLANYLIGECTSEELINHSKIKNLDVITSGPIPPNPLDIISQPQFEVLINKMRDIYNIIILDSPPLGHVSEYIVLMKYTDANIYVVRSDYTNKNLLERINELFEDKKISNVGILLNDVKVSHHGYQYRYNPVE
jgi:capsular exopolysaccharide synthesis family protein